MKRECVVLLCGLMAGFGATEANSEEGLSPAGRLRLTGPDGGLVLWEQAHTRYVESPEGLEVQARLADENAPLYLSLDVTDPAFSDGASPMVEFSFDYYDAGTRELTFDIDSSDPLLRLKHRITNGHALL